MTDTQWFREAGFGLFIHWGLYALQGLGEWAMYTSAIPAEEYRALADRFSPGHFDADKWAQLACGAGMRYMVMTTKHHDGFCLFDTRTTDFCSTKTAAGRDFVREYVDACRRHGLKVGLYFSVKDWQYPGYFRGPEKDPEGWAEFMRVYEAQLRELLTNYGKIDVLWFDGGDAPHFGLVDYPREAWQADRLERLVREMQPGILINGRAGMHADFGTPERTGYGVMAAADRPQEICDSLTAEAWGYRPGDPCISLREVMERIRGAAVNGCNLLLNASPRLGRPHSGRPAGAASARGRVDARKRRGVLSNRAPASALVRGHVPRPGLHEGAVCLPADEPQAVRGTGLFGEARGRAGLRLHAVHEGAARRPPRAGADRDFRLQAAGLRRNVSGRSPGIRRAGARRRSLRDFSPLNAASDF